MRRGTTPPLTVTVGGDISQYELYLTFKTSAGLVTKSGGDLNVEYQQIDDETVISCTLTQHDTLAMACGTCEVQLRGVDNGGADAIATKIGNVPVERILLDGYLPEEVIDDGDELQEGD